MLVNECAWLRSRFNAGFSFGDKAWTEMEIWCIKGMFMLKVVPSEFIHTYNVATTVHYEGYSQERPSSHPSSDVLARYYAYRVLNIIKMGGWYTAEIKLFLIRSKNLFNHTFLDQCQVSVAIFIELTNGKSRHKVDKFGSANCEEDD